jgi:hypothetical protein
MPTSRSLAKALGASLAWVIIAGTFIVAAANPADAQQLFTYAAKFACGTAASTKTVPVPPVAPGAYFTAVNVHNAGRDAAKLEKTFVLALPNEKVGRISRPIEAVLKPNEAFEIDCPEILKLLDIGAFQTAFAKGFVVIKASQELDVVAVYTTAARYTGPVTSFALERVPKRP